MMLNRFYTKSKPDLAVDCVDARSIMPSLPSILNPYKSASMATSTCDGKSKPTYIYKLISHISSTPTSVASLPERLPVSAIDEASGFIHLSTAVQIPNTLKFFFKEDPYVYLLRIPYDPVEKDIKWEDPKAEVCGPRGGEGMFPHLYNGLKLGKDEVESVRILHRQTDHEDDKAKGWDAALQGAEDFLVY